MKKILTLILAAAMVLSLAACGGSDAGAKAESKAAETAAAAQSKVEEAAAAAQSQAAEAASAVAEAATEAVSEAAEAATAAVSAVENAATDGGKYGYIKTVEELGLDHQPKLGFVMMGTGNEFFEGLIAAVHEKMTALGWEENMVSGDFDVSKQIEAIENFTADQVDVLLVFPVNGPAVTDAVKKARDAGIKVIIMVDETTDDQWDAFLSSDNEATGRCNAWLAADYINKTYPDAEPGSIPVGLIQIYDTPTDEQQSVGLEAITEYTDKVNVAARYEISGQNKEDGQKAAETLYTTNPEIKFFVTTSNAVALGFNEFYTGMASPISEEEYVDYGVWGTNASEEALTAVAASVENKAILRGINIQAGIGETATNIARLATGLLDGTVDHEDSPADVYLINADTVFTYFEKEQSPLQWDYDTKSVVEVALD